MCKIQSSSTISFPHPVISNSKSKINREALSYLNLKVVFFTVHCQEESRNPTFFKFNDERFCYNALPFGLASCPRIYNKILKLIISYLKSVGIKTVSYLDDIIIVPPELDIDILCSLWFSINIRKSHFSPIKKYYH